MVLVEEVNMLRRAGEGIRGGFNPFQSGFQVNQSARKSFPCTRIRSSVATSYESSYTEIFLLFCQHVCQERLVLSLESLHHSPQLRPL